jgi:hypothetical protein
MPLIFYFSLFADATPRQPSLRRVSHAPPPGGRCHAAAISLIRAAAQYGDTRHASHFQQQRRRQAAADAASQPAATRRADAATPLAFEALISPRAL